MNAFYLIQIHLVLIHFFKFQNLEIKMPIRIKYTRKKQYPGENNNSYLNSLSRQARTIRLRKPRNKTKKILLIFLIIVIAFFLFKYIKLSFTYNEIEKALLEGLDIIKQKDINYDDVFGNIDGIKNDRVKLENLFREWKNEYLNHYHRSPPTNFEKWVHLGVDNKCFLHPKYYKQARIIIYLF